MINYSIHLIEYIWFNGINFFGNAIHTTILSLCTWRPGGGVGGRLWAAWASDRGWRAGWWELEEVGVAGRVGVARGGCGRTAGPAGGRCGRIARAPYVCTTKNRRT